MAAATLVSRLLGFLRDAAVAWGFGTGFGADAFLAAFRIPNLFRRLLGEGSLSSAFVPVMAETLVRAGRREAQELAASATRVLALALTGAGLVGMLAAPLVVHVVAPGFSGAKFELTLGLTRLMLPYLLAAGIAALWMGTLNVLGSFAAPAATPALLNIAMIAGALGVAPIATRPESVLATAVLVGGGAQMVFLFFCLARQGVGFQRAARTVTPALRRAARLMLPVGLGSAVYQINVLVGGLLASFLPEGSVSCLYYAERLVEFPLGVVAVAGATAVLPTLAREAALGDRPGLAATLAYAFRMSAFVMLPATAGLLLLAEPVVALLFQRGAFGAESVRLTSQAVSYYAVGLMGVAAARMVARVFCDSGLTPPPARGRGLHGGQPRVGGGAHGLDGFRRTGLGLCARRVGQPGPSAPGGKGQAGGAGLARHGGEPGPLPKRDPADGGGGSFSGGDGLGASGAPSARSGGDHRRRRSGLPCALPGSQKPGTGLAARPA